DAERGRRAGKKELVRFGRRRIILIRAQAPIFGGLLDCFNLGYLVGLNQTAKPSNAPNVGAFYCPRVGERNRTMNELNRDTQIINQLRQLIGDWRTMANSKFLQTYNREKANGLKRAANDLEELLKKDEYPAATCSNCGTILRYGFCFNSNCEIDETLRKAGLGPDEIGAAAVALLQELPQGRRE
ncbi:hypothetical protein LCGC14_2887250, partial [marine sediment metagenome]